MTTPISMLTGFSLNCKKQNGVIFLTMTQKSGSHATFLQKNKLLGKQACPNENSLQAQGKNIVKTMDYQRNENFNTNKNNLF